MLDNGSIVKEVSEDERVLLETSCEVVVWE